MRRGLLLGLLAVLMVVPARAGAVALDPVGTFAAPIYVTAPPGDPRLFVVERCGTIRIVGAPAGTPFLDISTSVDCVNSERGLLSMAFDPDFASNGLFYVFYTGDGDDPIPGGDPGDVFIEEYQVEANPGDVDESTRRTVLSFPHSASNHNGGQLQFGPDGYLYISVGDNASSNNAQIATNFYGKLLRINPHDTGPGDYTVPASNPYFGSGSVANEIWSFGLRNPHRFSFDHLNGSLLIGDVGSGSREEVDYRPQSIGGGRNDNFGWPCYEGFLDVGSPGGCTTPGNLAHPVLDYETHVGGTCAIMGGFVYRGSDVPELSGRYVYADLCAAVLRSFVPGIPAGSGDRSEGVPTGAQPWSFGEDSRCELYVAAGNTVSRVVSSPGATPGSGGCQVAAPPPAGAPPVAKRRRCKKGKRLKKVRGKRRCVKKKRKRRR